MNKPLLMPVPGSERFASRPLPLGELRGRIDPSLRLHEISSTALDDLDPLTYEVIRHRIWSITDEMGETLKKMSGSQGVTEANDFDFAICDELGQEVQVGLYNTGLVASMDLAIYWILQHRSANSGIRPGDMFLTNDPWVGGGLHQNDTSIIAPIFIGEELFAWTSAVCHQIDVGGAKPGSANLTATDVFSEAVPTPPIRLVRGGEIQDDVLDNFARRSRSPMHIHLDIRAKVSANKVGQRRLSDLVSRYGPTTVKAVMKRMMDDAEGRLRARLTSIPDGSWSSVGYMEQSEVGDRGLHKICLTLTKNGSDMTFDFTGTDPQVGMINCPYSGMRAGIMFALLPVLAGDIPWSVGGFMRCLKLISEEGTINNASYPAAVGWAPISAAWATSNLVAECLGRMLDTSVELRPRVQACCTGSFDIVTLAGIDQRGLPSVSMLFDMMAGGYGAHATSDGGDTAGIMPIPMGRAPDVEMQEYLSPYLVLWRREEPDSGGAGEHRGGVSISTCLIPHGTPAPMSAAFSGNGKARAESAGLAGGLPGGVAHDIVVQEAHVAELFANGVIPSTIDELGGTPIPVPNRAEMILGLTDVMFVHAAGGGGYGDPLLRRPEAVAHDVGNGKVTRRAAEKVYGVLINDDGYVNEPGTLNRRNQIRIERVGPGYSLPAEEPLTEGNPISVSLIVIGDTPEVTCRWCGHTLGGFGSDLTEHVAIREQAAIDAIPGTWADCSAYVDEEIVYRTYCCPRCATQLHCEVTPVRQPAAMP
ncbi:hydantoinase B/oxoprolinase family protein [Mycobacterium vicinigordonae]|uniref:Hydantoinase B/oxoprolinase family protein n=1 Tax=Mycobacterium vicinigordonae TaxID=1719132 RepID=A0A7D6I5B8_9MYCO|nr:hydantoinase B/oxoprolinase family protein [Mycobacterium vicinigordonae]QLL06156.1 hydantoinase B/oxoprolinase family protein [Mycobacterium vicinigordonae]